jgi:hypothetical protein
VLRSQHRVYDGRGEVARTQDIWGAEGITFPGFSAKEERKGKRGPIKRSKARNLLERLINDNDSDRSEY